MHPPKGMRQKAVIAMIRKLCIFRIFTKQVREIYQFSPLFLLKMFLRFVLIISKKFPTDIKLVWNQKQLFESPFGTKICADFGIFIQILGFSCRPQKMSNPGEFNFKVNEICQTKSKLCFGIEFLGL